jgi:hypothetical protein
MRLRSTRREILQSGSAAAPALLHPVSVERGTMRIALPAMPVATVILQVS